MDLNSNNIKNMLEKNKNNYEIFQIKYNNRDKKCIAKYNLYDNNYEYSHFGDINMKDLTSFLSKIGKNKKNNIKRMKKIIKKIINIVIDGYKMKHFWLSIRVTQPNNKYDIPRWHQDGFFFENHEIIQSKFVTVLKGDGTIFIKSNETSLKIISDSINCFRKYIKDKNITDFREQIKINDDIYRPLLADKIKECNECDIIQLNNEQGMIFLVGDSKNALIHSEPKQNHKRIFISILPGSENDIKNLSIRFNKNQKGGINKSYKQIYETIKADYIFITNSHITTSSLLTKNNF